MNFDFTTWSLCFFLGELKSSSLLVENWLLLHCYALDQLCGPSGFTFWREKIIFMHWILSTRFQTLYPEFLFKEMQSYALRKCREFKSGFFELSFWALRKLGRKVGPDFETLFYVCESNSLFAQPTFCHCCLSTLFLVDVCVCVF